MDILNTRWWNWCRLCAKNDSANEIHIDSSGEFNEVLDKHFDVQSSSEDLFPKYICQECNSLISSLVLYANHVKRVQEMYTFLVENSADESCNLQAMRMKFNVCNGNKGQWCPNLEEIISNSTLSQSITIKREKLNSESDYEENYESTSKEEKFYDEEYLASDSRDDDHFDTMSEDSVWGDDDEIVDYESTENAIPTNTDNFNADKAEESSDQTNSKTQSTKKKPMVEDFVLDVACTVCEQKFTLYSAYCEHMEVMHETTNLEKYCPFCSRNLQTWYHLGRHMRTHMPVESRYPIKCPECDCRYTTSALLEVHLNHKHRNEKPYICEVCGFSGATKHSLTQHMFVHTDDAPYECEICKKRFKKRSRLNFHMDVHGPNKFVCTICGMQLNTRATLKKHFLVHSDKKRHRCDHCGTGFKQTKSLKDHLLLHLGLKPYTCNFCDITFSTRQPCRGHMMRVHPKEFSSMKEAGHKAYTKNVPTLAKLKEAIKTSDNVIPVATMANPNKPCIYKCNFCENKFSYRASRITHMKQKHPTEYASAQSSPMHKLRMRKSIASKTKKTSEPFTCEICSRTFAHRKLYESHVNKLHGDELALADNSLNAVNTTIPNVETPSEVADVRNVIQSMENSTLSLDLHTGPMTTAASIQDIFFIIE